MEDVTLKEFFTGEIRHNKELSDAEDRRLQQQHDADITRLEEKVDSNEREAENALVLKSAENEKHFTALNGEQGRITKILEASIPREVHERDVKEIRSLIDVLTLANTKNVTQDQLSGILKTPSEDIKILTSSKDVLQGRASQSTVNIALVFSILAAVGMIINLIIEFTK